MTLRSADDIVLMAANLDEVQVTLLQLNEEVGKVSPQDELIEN